MICKKCGANIADTAKFCGYCGSKLEQQVIDSTIQNVEQTNINSEVNNVLEKTQIIQPTEQNINSNNVSVEPVQKEANKKKNNNTWIFIILGVILVVLALVLLFIAFNNTKHSSVRVLEKAVANLDKNGENSGTINANVLIETTTSDTMNLSGTIKYSKVNDDSYNMALVLNKSILYEEMTMYAKVNEENMTLYAKSSVVDMLGYTSSDTDSWLYYLIETDLEDDVEDEVEDIDIEEILDEKLFKYVSKVNDINHYQLIIDQELINKINTEIYEEQYSNEYNYTETYIIDFYINDNNELVEISMDMTDYIDEEDISNVTISIEFLNLNSTVVTIPQDVLNSKIDLETYMSTYALPEEDYGYDYNDESYDYDINYNYEITY